MTEITTTQLGEVYRGEGNRPQLPWEAPFDQSGEIEYDANLVVSSRQKLEPSVQAFLRRLEEWMNWQDTGDLWSTIFIEVVVTWHRTRRDFINFRHPSLAYDDGRAEWFYGTRTKGIEAEESVPRDQGKARMLAQVETWLRSDVERVEFTGLSGLQETETFSIAFPD